MWKRLWPEKQAGGNQQTGLHRILCLRFFVFGIYQDGDTFIIVDFQRRIQNLHAQTTDILYCWEYRDDRKNITAIDKCVKFSEEKIFIIHMITLSFSPMVRSNEKKNVIIQPDNIGF